jgi:aminomuconate-semialdehyde/2-hydroxymuconate-6-semialdehyde dehydrogenase
MTTLANFIGGASVPPQTGAYLDNFEPATGAVIGRVPRSGEADVQAAVAAATAAFPAWHALGSAGRADALLRIAALLEARLDDFAKAESRDTGKPVSLARAVDIPRSIANLRFFAGIAQNAPGEFFESEPAHVPGGALAPGERALNYTLRRPRGVAALISPWNLPLYLLTWKVAPALATGNTAVCKPSEVTPSTAAMFGELCREAGLPAGVLNIVHGLGGEAGAPLVRHPAVPTVSFTGSTAVGRWIAKEAADRVKRVSLELGGKNPFIVFADADVEAAAATAARAAFTNQGQVCLCGSRLLVARPLVEKMTVEIVARAKALRIGDPDDPATQFGSLVSAPHLAKVTRAVEQARSLGGRILCGGRAMPAEVLPARCRAGYFYQPTVISGLDPACATEQEEIFGPVVTIQPFDTEDQAVAIANGTDYALAATIFTRDAGRAHRVAERVDAGLVWVNCWMLRDLRTPFGGARQSGLGREGGTEALRFFTEPKNVCLRID